MEPSLIVHRWCRYGADRLYVRAGTGAPLGSVDLVSGAVDLAPGARWADEAVRAAAQAFLRRDLPELVLPLSAVLGGGNRAPGRRAAAGPPDHPSGDLSPSRGRSIDPTPLPGFATGRPPLLPAPRGRHRADADPAPDGLRDRLERLVLSGWSLLHDVPVGRQGTVLDDLLIGPGGVFAVSDATRILARGFVLDGRRLSADGAAVAELREVRLAAARVSALLRSAVGAPVGVRGVLVVGAPVREVSTADALAVPLDAVPEFFARMPRRWDDGRVAALTQVAQRATTWSSTWARS
ncbi:NERD domain-containing protein [Cellulomonas sp. NPDC089187]|uniref:NERD domain-containing protein n=1 Tax=Cellulomonas sp. NPDC089187 TaxID=3154970 RepID=UPI00341616E1